MPDDKLIRKLQQGRYIFGKLFTSNKTGLSETIEAAADMWEYVDVQLKQIK